MKGYTYSEVNRLDRPNTYMYTEYIGRNFIDIYWQHRSLFISAYQSNEFLDNITVKNFEIIKILENSINKFINKFKISKKKFNFSNQNKYVFCNESVNQPVISAREEIIVDNLLDEIIFSCQDNNLFITRKSLLEKLLHKFEVTKKIFTKYDKNFKKPFGKSDELEIYLKLKIALIIYYIENNDIRYLNTIIKLSDTLCSQQFKSLKRLPKNLHLLSIESELILISQLKNFEAT